MVCFSFIIYYVLNCFRDVFRLYLFFREVLGFKKLVLSFGWWGFLWLGNLIVCLIVDLYILNIKGINSIKNL